MTKPPPETLEAYRRDVAVWDGYVITPSEHEEEENVFQLFRHGELLETVKISPVSSGWTKLPNYPSDANALRPCLVKLTDKEWVEFELHLEVILEHRYPNRNLSLKAVLTAEVWMPFVALWKTVCEKGKV